MVEGLAIGQRKLLSGQFEVISVVSKCKLEKMFSLLRRKLHRRHVFGKNRKNPSTREIVTQFLFNVRANLIDLPR